MSIRRHRPPRGLTGWPLPGLLLPVLLLPVLLLAGCIGPTREELLDPMVGQDVDVAIEAMGQPDETLALGEGRNAYIWRRVYDYELERMTQIQSNRHRPHWLYEEPAVVDVRLCETRLVVGFDFVIEGWDYGCRTVQVETDAWRNQPLARPHRRTEQPAK